MPPKRNPKAPSRSSRPREHPLTFRFSKWSPESSHHREQPSTAMNRHSKRDSGHQRSNQTHHSARNLPTSKPWPSNTANRTQEARSSPHQSPPSSPVRFPTTTLEFSLLFMKLLYGFCSPCNSDHNGRNHSSNGGRMRSQSRFEGPDLVTHTRCSTKCRPGVRRYWCRATRTSPMKHGSLPRTLDRCRGKEPVADARHLLDEMPQRISPMRSKSQPSGPDLTDEVRADLDHSDQSAPILHF